MKKQITNMILCIVPFFGVMAQSNASTVLSPANRGNAGFYNAWVVENRICVGQQKVKDKSNEITAGPSLIEEPDITDTVVSIDTAGCQRSIAEQTVDRGGHYLLSLIREPTGTVR